MTKAPMNVALLCVAIGASLLFGDFAARLVLHPVNYLNPTLVSDEFLGHRIAGGTGGHDEWGFRNFERPDRAEIVAIGDSMTYGVAAQAGESYPQVLGRLASKRVYNMGMGGYGPLQYLHVLKSKAVELKPRTAIVGLYIGNDLMDAFNMAHGHEAWKAYARRSFPGLPSPKVIAETDDNDKVLGALRDWLSRHSVLYRAMSTLSLFDWVREREFRSTSRRAVEARQGSRRMLFASHDAEVHVDPADPRVQEGLEITEQAFTEMAAASRQSGMRLIVVLFPLKESVYEPYLRASAEVPGVDRLLALVEDERAIKKRLEAFFREKGIEYLDLLPALRLANRAVDAYPMTDPHPNARGYAAVADAVYGVISAPKE